MSRPQIDFADLETAQAQLKVHAASTEADRAEWVALRDSLNPEQLERLYRVMRRDAIREWATGAQAALKSLPRFRHQVVCEVAAAARAQVDSNLETVKDDARRAGRKNRNRARRATLQTEAMGTTIARQNKLINRLVRDIRDERVLAEIAAAYPVELEAAAAWDYPALPPRTPGADEVLTSDPLSVALAADQVELYVRHHGPCSKFDVSAAFPQWQRHLTAAYRHLNTSRRIQVTGRTLQLWPQGEEGGS